jgi:hypothetical protein
MIISNVVEEVDIRPVEEKSSRDGVNGSITPSLVEEAPVFIERSEVIDIRIGPQPLQASDFKVGPLDKCQVIFQEELWGDSRNGTCCRSCHRRRSGSPLGYLPRRTVDSP